MLLERGIVFPRGRRKLELHLEAMMAEDAAGLSSRTRLLIDDMRAEWRELESPVMAWVRRPRRAA